MHKFIVETCQADTETSDEIKQAEWLAFMFAENHNQKNYYCCALQKVDEDGNPIEDELISQITPNMIDYWEIRGDECENPLLRARYFGLVWHFKKLRSGKKTEINIAQGYLDALIETANEDYYVQSLFVHPELEHGLMLAISLKQTERVNALITAIIELEKRHAEDDKAGTWGKAFDLLFDKRGVVLSTEQWQSIISDLESRLERLEAIKDTRGFELCAKRIAKYHRKHSRHDDARGVILRVGDFIRKQLEEDRKTYVECTVGEDGVKTLHLGKGSAFEHIHALEDLLKLYHEFNIRDFDDEILIQIREREPETLKFMMPISSEVTIPQEKIDKVIALFLTGTTEEIIFKLIWYFTPDRDEAAEQMKKSAKEFVFMSMLSSTQIDHKGRTVNKMGSMEDDTDARLTAEISTQMTYRSMFLDMAIHKLFEGGKLSLEDILQFVKESPTIEPDRYEIIRIGLEAYFKRDFITSVHLLIPQIENAVRNLLAMAGGNIYIQNRNGGTDLKPFNLLLDEKIVKDAMTDERAQYFRILFTDPKGWNLRNEVCHGMLPQADFTFCKANRVIHALLCIGALRLVK